MKKTTLSVLLCLAFGCLFESCNTKVDLFADYKDITIVYGILEAGKDTNFVKINKAYLGGDPIAIAMIPDSNNYPGKLDVKLIEYRANASSNYYTPTNRVLQLDTITIHNKETNGQFYAPDQKVYYTKETILGNTHQYQYQYELQIDRGDTILSSKTNIVGGESFIISTAVLNYSSSSENGNVKWYPCPNASVYQVFIYFNFAELRGNDTTYRTMEVKNRLYLDSELVTDHGQKMITYKTSELFTTLKSFLGADTLDQNVDRLIFEPCMKISIAAGGEALYDYISVHSPSSSIVQNVQEYTNIIGGYGVFSSRTLCDKLVKLSTQTLVELTNHPNWRFRQARGFETIDEE